MAKQIYECNWAPSRVTEEQLNNLVKTGALAKKNVIHWRVPGPENPPTPKDGEVVVFADHLVEVLALPVQKISEMYWPIFSCTLKALVQIL